jgi:hypothetical protein
VISCSTDILGTANTPFVSPEKPTGSNIVLIYWFFSLSREEGQIWVFVTGNPGEPDLF